MAAVDGRRLTLASFCRETHKLLACSGLALSRGEWVAGPALLKACENRPHVRKTGERAVSALILNRCTATAGVIDEGTISVEAASFT